MSGPLEIARDGDVVVARLDGEIDISNVPRISDDLLEAVPNEARGLVIDLSAVRYLDSAGVRMLFDVLSKLEGCRQAMALVVPKTSTLRRLMTMTKLHEAASLCESVSEGAAVLRESLDQPY